MTQQVTATPAALDLLERLRTQHGDLIVHVSGGCCDGSSPMCLRSFHLDVAPGTAGGFSLEALEDLHFTATSGDDQR